MVFLLHELYCKVERIERLDIHPKKTRKGK